MNGVVGFVGLGLMGRPMAERLIEAGFELVVWNRTPSKSQGLDARVAGSLVDVGERADTVVVMVADDDAVREVTFGADGLASKMSGGLVIDMSTTSVACKKDVAADFARCGVGFVDAPVFGSTQPARTGELVGLVGASDEDAQGAAPVLEALTKIRFHMGDVGAGTAMKLVGNSLGAAMTALIAQGLTVGGLSGLDPKRMLEVIAATGFDSPTYQRRGAQMMKGTFEPGWPVKHVLKDVRLAQAEAGNLGLEARVLSGVESAYRSALEAGAGEEDASAVVKGIDLQGAIWGGNVEERG